MAKLWTGPGMIEDGAQDWVVAGRWGRAWGFSLIPSVLSSPRIGAGTGLSLHRQVLG